jgi:hypothetical protein
VKCGANENKSMRSSSASTQEWLDPPQLLLHEWAVIFDQKITAYP